MQSFYPQFLNLLPPHQNQFQNISRYCIFYRYCRYFKKTDFQMEKEGSGEPPIISFWKKSGFCPNQGGGASTESQPLYNQLKKSGSSPVLTSFFFNFAVPTSGRSRWLVQNPNFFQKLIIEGSPQFYWQ